MPLIVVRSQIKDEAKINGLDNISNDFYEKLNEKTKKLIAEACQRAKLNDRRTLMGKDL